MHLYQECDSLVCNLFKHLLFEHWLVQWVSSQQTVQRVVRLFFRRLPLIVYRSTQACASNRARKEYFFVKWVYVNESVIVQNSGHFITSGVANELIFEITSECQSILIISLSSVDNGTFFLTVIFSTFFDWSEVLTE